MLRTVRLPCSERTGASTSRIDTVASAKLVLTSILRSSSRRIGRSRSTAASIWPWPLKRAKGSPSADASGLRFSECQTVLQVAARRSLDAQMRLLEIGNVGSRLRHAQAADVPRGRVNVHALVAELDIRRDAARGHPAGLIVEQRVLDVAASQEQTLVLAEREVADRAAVGQIGGDDAARR